MTITNKTELTFTEIKRGGSIAKVYNLTAEEFISIVKNKDHNGDLDFNLREKEDGDFVDDFYDLPIEQQLDMCCRAEGDRYAASTNYKVAE
jgi:hypothetical protein